MRDIRASWRSIALLPALLVALALPAAGESGAIGTLLPPGVADLQVAVDTVGLTGPGYRRVIVRVVDGAPTASTADRTIAIALSQGWSDDPESSFTTRTSFVLPAGVRSLSHEVWLPQFRQSQNLSWRVSVDGERVNAMTGNAHWAGSGHERGLLLVGTDRKPWDDVDGQALLQEPLQNQSYYYQRSRGTGAYADYTWQILPAEMPREWRGYSTSEFIAISLGELRQVAQDATALQALEQAVLAGADLCVFDLEANFAAIDEINGWFPPTHGPEFEAFAKVVTDRNRVEQDTQGQSILQRHSMNRRYFGSNVQVPNPPPINGEDRLRLRKHGLGQILAVASPRPFESFDATKPSPTFNPAKHDAAYLAEVAGPTLASVHEADGIVPTLSLPIPGIDEPPIFLFGVLITVFAVVIGPLNYFLLLRAGRLWLVIVTVPAAALVVIAGLLGYAWLTNGTTNYARSISFTFLDQPRGIAVAQADVAYFAGSPPSGGLVFPPDMLVLPAFESNIPPGGRTQRRDTTFLWEPAGQRLGAGFVPARTISRIYQKRVLADVRQQGILVRELADGGAEVTNKLGVPIVTLALTDSRGKQWHARGIAPNQKVSLHAGYADAISNIHTRANSGEGNSRRSGWRYNYYGGLEEISLRMAMFPQQNWSPDLRGSFVMEVEANPFLPLGAEGIVERESAHVIFGRWK